MIEINPEFLTQVSKIYKALDTLDYFQLLRVDYDAQRKEIRQAYHTQARSFHPDRYAHLKVPQLLEELSAISKRITEAYVTLRDDAKRVRYLGMIEDRGRRDSLRYTDKIHKQHTEEVEDEQLGVTPQGRQLYQQALSAWQNGNRETALQSLRMALVYEHNNPRFRALLTEWSDGPGPPSNSS